MHHLSITNTAPINTPTDNHSHQEQFPHVAGVARKTVERGRPTARFSPRTYLPL